MKATSIALRTIIVLLAAVLVITTGGCGGGGGGSSSPVSVGGPTTSSSGSSSQFVGTAVCTGCHTSFPYSNGFQPGDLSDTNTASPTFYDSAANGNIPTNYMASVHYATPTVKSVTRDTGSDVVTCEGCHGPGAQHYGVGPMPYNRPGTAQCETCHSGTSIRAAAVINLTEFNKTGHANPDSSPDQYFFQGGVGTAQASMFNSPEWADAGKTVPVSKNQHIEECSQCHSPVNEASQIAKGNVANPPQVTCSACHDPHRPADTQRNWAPARDGSGVEEPVAPEFALNLKPVKVNNNPAGAQFGAQNKSGTWIRPRLTFDYHKGGNAANTYGGFALQATTVATVNNDYMRISADRLCGACHAKGQYKYGVATTAAALPSTHQNDVFTQYHNSGHGHVDGVAWTSFSLFAPIGNSRRPSYPYDMGGKVGQNGTTVPFDGKLNGGGMPADCIQCHHGIASIDYMEGTVWGVALGDSKAAHILWGDSNVTCITCHDTHKNGAMTTKNVRQPKYMSYNTNFKPGTSPNGGGNARGAINKFLDLTDLPTNAGNNIVCIFCHQGRESGWTKWNQVRIAMGDANFVYNRPNDPVNVGTTGRITNDHYLAAGALLYSRNSNEFLGRTYSDGIGDHQTKGCTGCHMAGAPADNSAGGHTWKAQIQTCQECHKGITDFHNIQASADWDGDGVVETVFNEVGTIAVIAPNLDPTTVWNNGDANGGTGLFGMLNRALYASTNSASAVGPRYVPLGISGGQYFSTRTSLATAFSNGSPAQLWAGQNLNQFYKSGKADPATGLSTSQAVYVHNPYYAVQIMIDSLAGLGRTQHPTTGNLFATNRPAGATYGAGGTTHAGRDYRTLTP